MSDDPKNDQELREIPVSWEALEDAFENNAPEVHSYLHVQTGEVIRIVDGVADPQLHQRIMGDALYLRVDPVSSREQYRWMERFIATVEDPDLQGRLVQSIDGKGAFRRFKDVLMSFPVDRERWFTFRSERLRACMEGWLAAHDLRGVERPAWPVPTADDVKEQVVAEERRGRRTRAQVVDGLRARMHELADVLPARELDGAVAFLEFLRERRPAPRAAAVSDVSDASDASDASVDEGDLEEE